MLAPTVPVIVQTKLIERYQHHSIIHPGFFVIYTFSVSLGRVRMSFIISLSLSPTTVIIVSSLRLHRLGVISSERNARTSPGVHPVNRHRRFERALVCLELLQSVGGASSISDYTASLSRSKVLKDAGQLIVGRSGLLYVCIGYQSVSQCYNTKFHLFS